MTNKTVEIAGETEATECVGSNFDDSTADAVNRSAPSAAPMTTAAAAAGGAAAIDALRNSNLADRNGKLLFRRFWPLMEAQLAPIETRPSGKTSTAPFLNLTRLAEPKKHSKTR